MKTYEDFEIVYVGPDFQLFDSASERHEYARRDGLPLPRGYYIVSWPHARGRGVYDEESIFRGPFKRCQDAETNLCKFLALLRMRDGTMHVRQESNFPLQIAIRSDVRQPARAAQSMDSE